MKFLDNSKPLISLNNFSLWSGTQWVLHNVSLDVQAGSFCVFLGANGAGKSSVLKAMAGVVQPPWVQFGRLQFEHFQDQPAALHSCRPFMSWLPQSMGFSEDMSVREFLWLRVSAGRGHIQHDDVASAAVGEFGIYPLLDKRLSDLSGGQWQRVRLARALGERAALYLWDEPDTALDEAWRRLLWSFLVQRQSQGATVVVVLHRFAEVHDFVDAWFGLESGSLVFAEGRPGIFPQCFVERLFWKRA